MRIALVAESFPPDVNGVAISVARIADHIVRSGHELLVIAPTACGSTEAADVGYRVVRVPAMSMPGYPSVRLAPPSRRITRALRDFQPDLVHLASPFILGAWGASAARRLGVPAVAVFQTDIPAYARAYGVGFTEALAWYWVRRLHGQAGCTLVPSSATAAVLRAHRVEVTACWGSGVDSTLFHPSRRDAALRRELAPNGELIVGYIGRLGKEKQVELLAQTSRLPGIRVVIVGDGPTGDAVRRAIPDATFLGCRGGVDLARCYASLDVFVHTGPHETFCQTVQEAMASGIPVIAPAVGGPLDLVQHGRTGMLVPPSDSDAIVAAVRIMASDPDLRHAYGQAGRAAVEDRTWAALGDELIDHYRRTAVHATASAVAPSTEPVWELAV